MMASFQQLSFCPIDTQESVYCVCVLVLFEDCASSMLFQQLTQAVRYSISELSFTSTRLASASITLLLELWFRSGVTFLKNYFVIGTNAGCSFIVIDPYYFL